MRVDVDRLRSMLISEARGKRFGPAGLNLLNLYCDHLLSGASPEEAFEVACEATEMIGSDAAVLATRMKCELLITDAYERSGLSAPVIDFMSPVLMAAYDRRTGEVPGMPLEEDGVGEVQIR